MHVKEHLDATLQECATVFNVSHSAVWVRLEKLDFTLKKIIRYCERKKLQRWLFRRELEKFGGQRVFYLDECAWITACTVSLAARAARGE